MKNSLIIVVSLLILIACSGQLTSGQATGVDKANRARSLVVEASALIDNPGLDAARTSVTKLEEAAKLFAEVGDYDSAAYCYVFLANSYRTLGDLHRSLELLEKALPTFEKSGDKQNQLGVHLLAAANLEDLKEVQKAIDHYLVVLQINQEGGLPEPIAASHLRLGIFYSALEKHEESLVQFNEALVLFKSLENSRAELATMKSIGEAYQALGEYGRALECFQEIIRRNSEVKDKISESSVLNSISMVYSSVGESALALSYANNALSAVQQEHQKAGEAYVRVNLGTVLSGRGDKREALAQYEQALLILRELDDKAGEGATLSNIGALSSSMGDKAKAITYLDQALQLREAAGDKSGAAATLTGIGIAYADLNDYMKAKSYFMRSWTLARTVKNRAVEANALVNLSGIYIKSVPRLSVLLGKLAINVHQQLRKEIRGMESEMQKSYVRTSQIAYKLLAEDLISENRLAEAFQVVSSSRNQQSFDTISNTVDDWKRLKLTKREDRFARAFDEMLSNTSRISRLVEDAIRRVGPHAPDETQRKEISDLQSQLTSSNEAIAATLKRAETEFSISPTSDDDAPEISDLSEMRGTLDTLNKQTGEVTAAVYTVYGKERLTELLITAEGVKAVSSPIRGEDLSLKAKAFVDALTALDSQGRPIADVTDQAKELYNIVYRPALADLPRNISTIMWSLDNDLRYVPLGALHDGSDYVVRKQVKNVVFTRTDSDRLLRSLNPNWQISVFASSAPRRNVRNLNTTYEFRELKAVDAEVSAILSDFKVVTLENVLINQNFTKDSMIRTLGKKHPVVHLSSHFSLKPGDASRSFLLLGDGTTFPLSEMRKEPKLFDGVDLLTLSACSTGIDEPNSDGREVDGFAELAQRLGATSVLATLWPVNECSTAQLVKGFYENKLTGKKTKAEALRLAQLAMLDGNYKQILPTCSVKKEGTDDNPVTPKSTKLYKAYKPDPSRPYAHPYYWSPFVLYGNWK